MTDIERGFRAAIISILTKLDPLYLKEHPSPPSEKLLGALDVAVERLRERSGGKGLIEEMARRQTAEARVNELMFVLGDCVQRMGSVADKLPATSTRGFLDTIRRGREVLERCRPTTTESEPQPDSDL